MESSPEGRGRNDNLILIIGKNLIKMHFFKELSPLLVRLVSLTCCRT